MAASAAPRRVVMMLPCAPDARRGNATTALRIAEGLRARGWTVDAVEAGGDGVADTGPADLAVALHAARSGPAAHAWAEQHAAPYVVLFTGTDLNGRPRRATRAAVEDASACVALGRSARRRARDLFPGARDRIEVIVQGVRALPAAAAWPEHLPALDADDALIVCPSGVRAIKDPLRLVHALDPLAEERPHLRLWIAGPERERSYADRLRQELRDRPWAEWVGTLGEEALAAVLARAALVVSTSRSEGGPPNALLEAARLGRPLLASAIPAHRDFPGAAHCFRDDGELRARVVDALEDPASAAREARKLQEVVRERHHPRREAEAWDRLLTRVLREDRAARP